MGTSYADYPHKESNVDVSSWHWSPNSTYTITFIATNAQGGIIGQQSERVYINVPAAAQVSQSSAVSPQVSQTYNALAGWPLYVDPSSNAAQQAKSWSGSRPADAALMQRLANQPTAAWFGSWNADVYTDVRAVMSRAATAGQAPVLVAYNIPARDCGSYSSGGANSPGGYLAWVGAFASAIGNSRAVVVLEPDALANVGCLSAPDQTTRLSLITQAVSIFKQNKNTAVYVDAGHAGWIDAATMASRLTAANIALADGFALNVSNFDTTSDSVAYGMQISAMLSNKHFIIDTSRNGNGSNGQWCNPWGRAVGQLPTAQTGNAQVDAYRWVKTPGESDGPCNGGPAAGTWWPDYALQLVQNAH